MRRWSPSETDARSLLLGEACGVAASRAAAPAAPAINAITAPTGALSPSLSLISPSTPSSKASSTMLALSVSTSAIGSPRRMLSPGCLSHRMILPSSIVSESLGIVISLLIVWPFPYLARMRRRLTSTGCGAAKDHGARRRLSHGNSGTRLAYGGVFLHGGGIRRNDAADWR